MRHLNVHPDFIPVSQLIFGCASIGGRIGRREGLRVLGEARRHGVNAFDTARSYGFGDGERILGEFLRTGRRDEVILISKAGISAPRPRRLARFARTLGRSVIRHLPLSRLDRWRRRASAVAAPALTHGFEPSELRASLERSLAELRTDYLDVFLLHAPPDEIVERDDVFEFLDRIRKEGKARLVGVSGPRSVVFASLARHPRSVDALQFALDATTVLEPEIAAARNNAAFQILMQPFGGGRLIAELTEEPEVRKLCNTFATTVPELLLAAMLALPEPPAPVLLSSWNPDHLRRNVALAEGSTALGPAKETMLAFARAASSLARRKTGMNANRTRS